MTLLFLSIIGLIIGSFLNVIISRYPEMLRRSWRAECREFLDLPPEPLSPTLNLALPRSQCPHCRHYLRFWHNIPLVSYLLLRGRCGFCRQRISIQYPIVELLTALLTLAVFLQFGWQLKTLALWLLSWSLIVLAAIDWKNQILPDTITLSLLWIGLILNIYLVFTPLGDAVWGAVTGYILLAVVAWAFKLIRKKPGMGHGDFKMLAMLGAWVGTLAMLQILLIAVLLSLVVTLVLLAFKKVHRDQPLPFGPWLALSGWVMVMYGPYIDSRVFSW
jgi:leader peptidase (prepilin peptidase) / N-methyltransferase